MKAAKTLVTMLVVMMSLSGMMTNAEEQSKNAKKQERLFLQKMMKECQQYEATAFEFYHKWTDGRIALPPFRVLMILEFYKVESQFVGQAESNPEGWILCVEKHIKQLIARDSPSVAFFWGPYIFVTMRDYPAVGRAAIRDFIAQNQLSPRNCIDFFGSLTPFISSFMAKSVLAEKDVIAMFQRTLQDPSYAYDYASTLPSEDSGVIRQDADGTIHPPRPGRVITGKMRACDLGFGFAFAWFRPQGIKFDEIKFVESTEAQRDILIAQMRQFLTEREKDGAAIQALEDELRGQYAARLSPGAFAAKLAEWQKCVGDRTGDRVLYLLLDTLFYQIGRNEDARMDDRDAQMTAYLAEEVRDRFAKDGLKVFEGVKNDQLRRRSAFYDFYNPLTVQVYKNNLPLDFSRNAAVRMLMNDYKHKYDNGELFRLPGEPPAPPESAGRSGKAGVPGNEASAGNAGKTGKEGKSAQSAKPAAKP